MQFQVKFTSSIGQPVTVPGRNFGLVHLDRARRELGVALLSPHVVSGSIEFHAAFPIIPLSEAAARQAGHFEQACVTTVTVPRSALNKFMSVTPVVRSKDQSDGAILRVAWIHVLDGDSLIEEWSCAGFPLEWDLELEEEKA